MIPYAKNARTHSEAQIAQIAASIREFGFTNPILIDDKNGVIAGHGRLSGARKLGMTEVPTIKLSQLSEAQRKAYIIADNRLAELSTWDKELLSVDLQELRELDFDFNSIGFDISELDNMYQETETKIANSNKELSEDDFSEFEHKCPKCGFEFD